ncbi:MAG: DUF2786 domain-containing protein [Nocardiaceae bacterium]|nr:DUF2786 domain-containing protein [Nocardiaceae bacterium]
MPSDKLLTRIAGLLRQAEGTDNPHEAEAFMTAAQRLATQSSIDLAVARAHKANKSRPSGPVHRIIPIGEPGKRGLRTYVLLFARIAQANDVRCDVAHNSTSVHAFGFEPDVDTVQALYSSLVIQMVRASDFYIKSGTYRAAGVAAVTARLNFQTAYAQRIGQRLADAKAATESEAVRLSEPGTALALRNKELELKDYYRTESQARGTWRGGRTGAEYSASARQAGDHAAQRAKLGADTELSTARTRLTS